jgi:hypothetical protein
VYEGVRKGEVVSVCLCIFFNFLYFECYVVLFPRLDFFVLIFLLL